MKTRNLIGPALDWAVAKCEGKENTWGKSSFIPYDYYTWYSYSTDWSLGGPIIERECVDIYTQYPCVGETIWYGRHKGSIKGTGPTPLIAAMRSYVASKLGDDVDIPEELL